MQKSRLRVRISALPLLVLSCCLDLTADGLQNPTAVELIGPRSTEAPRGTGGEIVFAGKGLDQVARDQVAKFMFAAEQNGTPDQAIEFSAPELKKQVEDGKKTEKLVVRYEIAKEANLGPHPLRAADKDNNVIVVDSVLTVLPGAPGISPRYVPCPTDGRPMDGSLGVVCSQSLLAWKEASDIFGRRIANFYLVVQLTVRNLRDDFEYLVHDVRLVYDNEHVASRERELVRGVAEKGQGYDRRNLILRAMQAGGSVLAATGPVDNILLKDAANLFQGPFTNGYELLFPDFTVRQANRVSDKVFATNATVVPKGRAVTTVALMPKDIFLSPEDREKHKNGNEKLLNFQRDLRVEIAGAHILEIRSDEPAANTLFPNTGVQREKLQTQLTGQNLDRVEKLRILIESRII